MVFLGFHNLELCWDLPPWSVFSLTPVVMQRASKKMYWEHSPSESNWADAISRLGLSDRGGEPTDSPFRSLWLKFSVQTHRSLQ